MLLQDPSVHRISTPRGRASDPESWRPVQFEAVAPTQGVAVAEGGLFLAALQENADYLLRSFSVEHMLYPFRARAGQRDIRGKDTQVKFWDTCLEGSNAGRFLMGAGNTLRWLAHDELRGRMDALVDGIEACRGEDGYIHGFPPEEMISGGSDTSWAAAQRSNYARAWLTHGLIDASIAGNDGALTLIRDGHDWFNRCSYLAELPRVMLWAQGHIASTRMYFTPLGKPEDLQVAERYYVVDDWMDRLASRDLEAIWMDGLGNPHCYEITGFEAYLDHYLAIGDPRYLHAVEGAWEMISRHWMHVGGSVALCEALDYPPDSRFIDPKKRTGELCGSVFWAKLNQRFHQMHPADERYVAEVEKCIYNVALANQVAGQGIRYHANLEGHKELPTERNTCCEGQGTRFLGSLPEYIYSLAEDGIYVNLFEPSSLDAKIRGRPVSLRMETCFPRDGRVRLELGQAPGDMKLRVRVPGWACGPMSIEINGRNRIEGQPGSYVLLDREWTAGDVVEFELPFGLRLKRYRGVDNFDWHLRFSMEYGPFLLGVVGPPGERIPILLHQGPEDLAWLYQVGREPLCWEVRGHPGYSAVPYYRIPSEQHFTCFPVLAGRGRSG